MNSELFRFGRCGLICVDEPSELSLDLLAFGCQEHTGSIAVHILSLTCPPLECAGGEVTARFTPTKWSPLVRLV